MRLLHDIGYLLLFVAVCVAVILPPSAWWERRWNRAQAALKKSDPQAYDLQAFRAGRRFERIDMTIVILGATTAFVLTRRCMLWWGG